MTVGALPYARFGKDRVMEIRISMQHHNVDTGKNNKCCTTAGTDSE